ncbi:MAG: EAL domain-containing protein [Mesorhizobium sp.]
MMVRVVSCLVYDHDYSFVLIAAIACLAGSAITLQLFNRSRRRNSDRRIWIFLSGVAGGTAIWTTHFVAMLGFNPPVEHAYEPVLTLASLFAAVAFTVLGLHVATYAASNRKIAFGGAIIGIGIAVMHFTGMMGLDIAGYMVWDPALVAASIVLGVTFAALATTLQVRSKTERGKWGSFGCLVLAICSMHFTAMGAVEFYPAPGITVSQYAFSSELIAISIVAAMSVATGIALYMVDVRSQREMLEGFRHASLHDPLTGIPNRAHLSALLPEVLNAAGRSHSRVGVLVIDLDRFKEINDLQGHEAGDAVLRAVTRNVLEILGPGEFFARMGGDEFVAIKTDVDSQDAVFKFAKRIEAAASQTLSYQGRQLSVGASIGIALFPKHAQRSEELLLSADFAMYRAKRSADSKICVYEPSVDDVQKNRSALVYELRQALEQKEFELFYQPLVDVKSNRITAFEALLRWRHPTRGIIEPGEFLSIAESSGLIVPLGNWALEQACSDAARWSGDIRVAVNIAAAQVYRQDLPQLVRETLWKTGLDPSRLEIEMTEESIVGDPLKAMQVIRQIKALGATIAMDDYGTGYSSLANLRVFPFDKIKIDRAFIADVTTNAISSAIVRSSILLARDLGIAVVAEGVENEDHYAFLLTNGCSEAQGYLFARPSPISTFASTVTPLAQSTQRVERVAAPLMPAARMASG